MKAVKVAAGLCPEVKLPIDMGASPSKRKATEAALVNCGVEFLDKPRRGALCRLARLPLGWRLVADKTSPLWKKLLDAAGSEVAVIFGEVRKGYPAETYLVLVRGK